MTRPTIKIYIKTDLKGPAKREGRYMFVLQFCTSKGTAEMWEGGLVQNVGENQLLLVAVQQALSHITKSSDVIFFVDNEYFKNTITKGWLKVWIERGWQTAKGAAPANMLLWRSVNEYLLRHVVTFNDSESNEFGRWLSDQLLLEREVFAAKYFTQAVQQRIKIVEDLIR